MRVTEIFYSIQGESTHAGRPCLFVRLTGCPLRCVWCDTTHAFDGGAEFSVEEIISRLERFPPCRLVLVTGGEPLAQSDTGRLVEALLQKRYEVLVETSGAIDIDQVDRRACRIMDIKCPGSGESEKVVWRNIDRLTENDQVKLVIADRADFEYAVSVIREQKLADRCSVLLSPARGRIEAATLSRWMLEESVPARLQLQLHKIIWGEGTRK